MKYTTVSKLPLALHIQIPSSLRLVDSKPDTCITDRLDKIIFSVKSSYKK